MPKLTTLRRYVTVGCAAGALTAGLFSVTACKPTGSGAHASHPEKFTAKLTEIEGVQAVYTVRHPKLILGEFEKLTRDIPEAAIAGMFLGQLAPYGYPEFTEIAEGSNIGIALLELTTLEAEPAFVAFAKLKEGGKIWTALTQAGFSLEKRDQWVWIAKDPSAFAKLKSPAALLAHIEKTQTEELKGWGRISPSLLSQARTAIIPQLEAKLASYSAENRKAALSYFDVVWSYVAQLHSAGGSLDLNDTGIALTYSGQFLPDSPAGVMFRHKNGATPKIAESLPADSVVTGVFHQDIGAQQQFVTGLLDALIAVNNPSGTELLRKAKDGYTSFAKTSDGGAVLAFDFIPPTAEKTTPEVRMLGINTGNYTHDQVLSYYRDSITLTEKATSIGLALAQTISPASAHTKAPQIKQELAENALTIDGIRFDKVTTSTTVAGSDQKQTQVQFFGIVNGNLIYGTDEAELRQKVPAIAAKKTVANPVKTVLKGDELAVFEIAGDKIVDQIATALKLDLNDADVKAQLNTMKEKYREAGAVRSTVSSSQAQATVSLTIPYKFIAQSIRLGQLYSSHVADHTQPGGVSGGQVTSGTITE